ncbi:ABC-2 family transporter protein [Dermatophilaceae bacterium Soc4.6]
MAEASRSEPGARLGRAAPYVVVARSRLRAQRSYGTSFAFDLVGSLMVGLTELGEVWVVFHNVTVLGGLDFSAVLLLFGLSNLGFSLGDMVFGHIDNIPGYIRTGTLEAFYLRPQPILAQLMVSDIQLRRLSRTGVAVAALVAGLVVNDIDWGLSTVVLLVLTAVSGVAIFGGLFVWAGALQFRLVNGAEVTNSFTYGGSYAASQPASIFPTALKVTFGYLVPVVFTAYLPTLRILDLPGPSLLPSWLAWLTPVAAVWVWGVAVLLWRDGLRHYQSGGG